MTDLTMDSFPVWPLAFVLACLVGMCTERTPCFTLGLSLTRTALNSVYSRHAKPKHQFKLTSQLPTEQTDLPVFSKLPTCQVFLESFLIWTYLRTSSDLRYKRPFCSGTCRHHRAPRRPIFFRPRVFPAGTSYKTGIGPTSIAFTPVRHQTSMYLFSPSWGAFKAGLSLGWIFSHKTLRSTTCNLGSRGVSGEFAGRKRTVS